MDLPQLRDFIVAHFNDNELRDLCFDLGIDYESLPGEGKAAKARELTAYCQRRDRLAELEATCLRLRSDASNAPAPADRPSARSTGNQSGGVTINAQTVNITGDVTGRDKTVASSTSASDSGSTPPAPPPPPTKLQATPPPAEDQFDYDVFISYSSKDKEWVRGELLQALEDRGLRAIVDFRDFRPGAPSIKEIERAVLTSRRTLLILSPAYLASQWTEFENLLLQMLEPSNQSLRLIPLLKVKCDLPPRLRMLTYVNFVDPNDWDIAWWQLIMALGIRAASPAGSSLSKSNKKAKQIKPEASLLLVAARSLEAAKKRRAAAAEAVTVALYDLNAMVQAEFHPKQQLAAAQAELTAATTDEQRALAQKKIDRAQTMMESASIDKQKKVKEYEAKKRMLDEAEAELANISA
jgi:hypothetical protein